MRPKDQAKALMAENERLARAAEKQGNTELAKVHWQLAYINAQGAAIMNQPKKPKGHTKKTRQRIDTLKDLRAQLKPANNEHFAALIKEKPSKKVVNLWSKKQLTSDATILNFIKKYRV